MSKTYSIVGQKFLGLDAYLIGINAGCDAYLMREPTNKFDPNAIRVMIDGKAVGYIPKKDNAALAQYIDQTDLPTMAFDSAQGKCLKVRFIRSANSSYPQVQIVD